VVALRSDSDSGRTLPAAWSRALADSLLFGGGSLFFYCIFNAPPEGDSLQVM
jgi:hypothetical protein